MDASAKVDLFIVGSVAVNERTGARLASAGALEELEYSLLREIRALRDGTPVVTVVRDLQLVDGASFEAHAVPVNIICTPTRTIRLRSSAGGVWQPSGQALRGVLRPSRAKARTRRGSGLRLATSAVLKPGSVSGSARREAVRAGRSKARSGKGGQAKQSVGPAVARGRARP